VFVTWSIEPCGLPTRSRSWLTSSGVAFHRTAPSCEEPDFYSTAPPEGSLVFRRPACPLRTSTAEPKSRNRNPPAKAVRCSAALLGITALASRFAHQVPRNPGAASRERRSPLPAPLPGWPRKEPESSLHCLPAEIGPLVTCRALVPLPALGEAGTAVPITHTPCTSLPSRGSEKCGKKPVDNGDIGNNNWNDFESRFGCRSVPPALPQPGA
jgi:hypothetical protein